MADNSHNFESRPEGRHENGQHYRQQTSHMVPATSKRTAGSHYNNSSDANNQDHAGFVPAGIRSKKKAYSSGSYNSGQEPFAKKEKRAGKGWRVVFWAALIVFIGSLTALGFLGFSYYQGQVLYKDVANEAFIPPQDSSSPLDAFVVDWDALLEKNPDTVGWIYIPNTPVNYPIVQTNNDDTYLTTDFLGGRGTVVNFGSIFLSAINSSDFSDANNIIYGHHMNDGSMFATIDSFRDSAEFNAHRTIFILTPQGNYRLTSFSLVICSGDDPLVQPAFANRAEMDAYLQDKMDRSVVTLYSNPVVLSSIEKSFALVTCDYTIPDGRAVLFASVTESTASHSSAIMPDDGAEQNFINPNDVSNIDTAIKELE